MRSISRRATKCNAKLMIMKFVNYITRTLAQRSPTETYCYSYKLHISTCLNLPTCMHGSDHSWDMPGISHPISHSYAWKIWLPKGVLQLARLVGAMAWLRKNVGSSMLQHLCLLAIRWYTTSNDDGTHDTLMLISRSIQVVVCILQYA
jgi:hypothetical protein